MNVPIALGILLLSHTLFFHQEFDLNTSDKSIIKTQKQDLLLESPTIPIIFSQEFQTHLDKIEEQVYQEPKNAFLDSHGNIVKEEVGYQLDRNKYIEKVYYHYFSKLPLSTETPLKKVYPNVDSELLDHIRIKKIGKYVTHFNKNKEQRRNNIALATDAINNTVLLPNEQFSFNKIVGQRTLEKGYLEAPVIINGEYSTDVGGGICQVSTTLFNAVDHAGLEIIARYSHSREINYVPPKRDATVSWNGPDFVFKNNYNQPILIQAKMLGNYLLVEVFSSDTILYQPRVVPYLP